MDYNSRLKPQIDKGLCGDPEIVESEQSLDKKVQELVDLVRESNRIVIFTGAGISTSSGIPDFRGPNGVWTKELQEELTKEEPVVENLFDSALPSFTHYATASLLHLKIFTHIVSQNVDGLHLRSGVPESSLSELHGNIFKEKCSECALEYVRNFDVGGMGLKPTGRMCEVSNCIGELCDMAVDWDTVLPAKIFARAEKELDLADLVISMGTSLRVQPAGNLPLRVVKPKKIRDGRTGKMVIVNLQKTHLDKKAHIRISHYCDEVMKRLCDAIGLQLNDTKNTTPSNVETCYRILKGSILEKMLAKRSVMEVLPVANSGALASTATKNSEKKSAPVPPVVPKLSISDVLAQNESEFKKTLGEKTKRSVALSEADGGLHPLRPKRAKISKVVDDNYW